MGDDFGVGLRMNSGLRPSGAHAGLIQFSMMPFVHDVSRRNAGARCVRTGRRAFASACAKCRSPAAPVGASTLRRSSATRQRRGKRCSPASLIRARTGECGNDPRIPSFAAGLR